MNFVRKLSTVNKKRIIMDSHFYNFTLSQNSKEIVNVLNGSYNIADNVAEYYSKYKKVEMHESHSPKPFIFDDSIIKKEIKDDDNNNNNNNNNKE